MYFVTKTIEYFLYGVELLMMILFFTLIANLLGIEVKFNAIESAIGLGLCVIIFTSGKLWLAKKQIIIELIKDKHHKKEIVKE